MPGFNHKAKQRDTNLTVGNPAFENELDGNTPGGYVVSFISARFLSFSFILLPSLFLLPLSFLDNMHVKKIRAHPAHH